jgi:chromosome segregation protein
MRIKRIELRGFKSFADGTVLQFGPGIAAVVGPNGCGKSNVIDAVRWTLGEQSPGTLRGRAMSDVIFAGSDSKPPSNRAAVSLVFDNTDGSFGGRFGRYAEIEVSRRLDRSGDSTYEINRQRSRLKDVTALFMDTGVGARAYSIIEQGRVGFVVNARPEERRVLIDEVAGINRFKGQKAETERRLEITQANLLRAADLCSEMGRQRKALQSQVRRADRFLELRRSWRQLSLRASLAEAVDHHRERGSLEERVGLLTQREGKATQLEVDSIEAERQARKAAGEASLAFERHRDALAAAHGKVKSIEREVAAREEESAELRHHLASSEHAAAESASGLASIGLEVIEARREADVARLGLQDALAARASAEQAELQARNEAENLRRRVEASKGKQLEFMVASAHGRSAAEALQRRIAEAEGEQRVEHRRQVDVDTERVAAQEGLARMKSALESACETRAKRAAELDAAEVVASDQRGRADAAEGRASEARNEVQALRARVSSERDVVVSLTGFQPGVRALVDWLGSDGQDGPAGPSYAGVVADLLLVPPTLEDEVEQALGPLLGALVFREPAGALAAAHWLAERALGSVALIVVDGDPGPPEGLASAVSDAGLPGVAARVLGGVQKYAEVAQLPVEARDLAGVSGRVSLRHGVLTVGVPTEVAAGQLARRRQLRGLEETLTERTHQEVVATEALARASEAVARAVTDRDRVAAAGHEAELAELAARRDVEEATRLVYAIATEVEKSAGRQARLSAQLEETGKALERSRTDLAQVDRREESERRILAELKEHLRRAEASSSAASKAHTSSRILQAEARQSAALGEREARRLEAAGEALERRATQERDRSARAAARLEVLDALVRTLVVEARAIGVRIAHADAADSGLRRARDEAQAAVSTALESSRTARLQARELSRELAGAQVELADRGATLRSALQRSLQDLGIDLAPAVARLARGEHAELVFGGTPGREELVTVELQQLDGQGSQLAAEASRVDKASRALGAVNLAARPEFDELDARWQELTAQRTDLEAAVGDLHRALAKIAEETRNRFLEAFDAVARHFAALYPRLVGGGRGELQLSDPAHPLSSGVDVRVEPPGKRLQTLRLLSGGEKAMAAIALVFAVFEVKPSPFCLLDEVDAPLDEANSRRFNAMLRQLSTDTQFVVITHNRTTMEVADVLYGVTMQEPGVSAVVSVQLSQVPL